MVIFGNTPDTYQSCRTFFSCDNKPDNPVTIAQRCRGFADCFDCKHFQTHLGDYVCNHPDGRNCIMMNINHKG